MVDFLISMCISIVSVFLAYKASFKEKEARILLYFLSFVPILNAFLIFFSLFFIGYNLNMKFKKTKRELEYLNTFKECTACEIIVRDGYIKNGICPVCKQESRFFIHRENYKPSNKIEEQKEIKNLKKFKEGLLNEKTEEQERKHLKVLEKRLKDKKL